MSISSNLTKLTTDITNAYTSINNKGGTIPANKNTDNLHTAIDSIEVTEQATAEGESLSLTNTKAMPYSDYVVKGKSEQATRSGKNLWNNNNVISTTIMTPNSNGGFKIQRVGSERISGEYPINIPANTNVTISSILKSYTTSNGAIYCQWIAEDNTTIWIPNIYNYSITTSFNKDIKGIRFYLQDTASDGDYVEIEKLQIEIGSTATSYEPYGASPSPSNPSEIHSVADDVNLLQNNITTQTVNGITFTKNDDGTITANGTATANAAIDVGRNLTNLFSKGDYIASGCPNRGTSSTYQITLFKTVNSTTSALGGDFGDGVTANITEDCYLWERIVIYSGQTVSNLIFKPKIAEGTTSTPYSPYNQGTVTIKQRGKNLAYTGWAEDFINRINDNTKASLEVYDNRNCLAFYPSAGYNDYDNKYLFKIPFKENTQYTFKVDKYAISEWGDLGIIYTDGTMEEIRGLVANTWNSIKKTSSANKTIKYLSVRWRDNSTQYLDLDTFMVYEGTEESAYEPYQGYDKVFQTEPLRSLPNGVKDTIEADGIHRRVGRQIFSNVEFLTNTTLFGVEGKFGSYELVGAKNEGRTYTFMSDKIMYANEEFLQYGAFRNSTNLLVMTTADDTLENYNSKISGSEVLYELETEVIEPFTQQQATTYLDIIKTGSYEGTTNIYTDEDVKPTIEVEYYKKG